MIRRMFFFCWCVCVYSCFARTGTYIFVCIQCCSSSDSGSKTTLQSFMVIWFSCLHVLNGIGRLENMDEWMDGSTEEQEQKKNEQIMSKAHNVNALLYRTSTASCQQPIITILKGFKQHPLCVCVRVQFLSFLFLFFLAWFGYDFIID